MVSLSAPNKYRSGLFNTNTIKEYKMDKIIDNKRLIVDIFLILS